MKCLKLIDFVTNDKVVIEIPKSCSVYEDDMDKIVTCPNCGKKLKFGDTYTSLTYLTETYFGFGVCGECYNQEYVKKLEGERERKKRWTK